MERFAVFTVEIWYPTGMKPGDLKKAVRIYNKKEMGILCRVEDEVMRSLELPIFEGFEVTAQRD